MQMNTDTLRTQLDAYLKAYADIPATEREQLLRQSVTPDITFTNPNGEGRGFEALVKHIEGFQKVAPGTSFKRTSLIAHHNELLVGWTMCQADGSALANGHTFARFDEQQRLAYTAGFFVPPPHLVDRPGVLQARTVVGSAGPTATLP